MKKTFLLIIAAVVVYGLFLHEGGIISPFLSHKASSTDSILQKAYKKQESGLQVRGKGVVIKTLSDDFVGSRHQRFILELDSGQTLLIAHNIDLAPRIDELLQGDDIEFYGEYEWNYQGGVIHWTHHDPSKKHVSGWLIHRGRTYK